MQIQLDNPNQYCKTIFLSGDVCLFYVENESALRTINFKSKKSKRIHIASEPIVSINIMEISADQRLLVATKSTIYHIKLHSVVN